MTDRMNSNDLSDEKVQIMFASEKVLKKDWDNKLDERWNTSQINYYLTLK